MAGYHGASARESEVLALWDAGCGMQEIANRLGLKLSTVQGMITRLAAPSSKGFEDMVKRGSVALLDAIRRHHPDAVQS